MAITMYKRDNFTDAIELVVRIPRNEVAAMSQEELALAVYRAMLNTTDSPPEEEEPAGGLRGWTEEENAEHQRRAGVVFEKYVGQPLTDYTLGLFKQDMLEEGIPVESVGITFEGGQPSLTVIFEHKPR